MRQRSIQIARLVGYVVHEFFIGMMIDCLHQVQTVDNHYYNHANVFGKRQQQFVEVVVLHSCLLLI